MAPHPAPGDLFLARPESGSVFGFGALDDGASGRAAVGTTPPDHSRPSSSASSPAPPDNEESDFYNGANDSQSSLGPVPVLEGETAEQDLDLLCHAPIHRLPNEILICVFRKLSTPGDLFTCMLVCKRWARNSVEMLWHRPACTDLDNLAKICWSLTKFHPFFTYRDFVRRINLTSIATVVNDGSIASLAVCGRVERLTLTHCRELTDEGLVRMVQNSPNLLALDISFAIHITAVSVKAIADHCKRLQGLNVTNCINISNESLIKLAQNCRFIKRLKLNDCDQVRDEAIMAFALHCPNILEIDLNNCRAVSNAPVTALLSHGQSLRELRLANCELVDDEAFVNLPAGKTYDHLRILDLSSCTGITDVAVQKIIAAAPRLRNLVLAKCRNLTDAAISTISRLGKNLHYLHMGHCSNITDAGLQKLVQECNRIRYIDLACCAHLTDDSIMQLALLPKLKRIGLVKCFKITDESIRALASRKPRDHYSSASHLERVHLSYCTALTLASIYILLNSCPGLTHLSLTGVPAFQSDDFALYCRPAPPEYTQHQRDMFCVFSGASVARFREFLNTNHRYDYLKDALLKHQRTQLGAAYNASRLPPAKPGPAYVAPQGGILPMNHPNYLTTPHGPWGMHFQNHSSVGSFAASNLTPHPGSIEPELEQGQGQPQVEQRRQQSHDEDEDEEDEEERLQPDGPIEEGFDDGTVTARPSVSGPPQAEHQQQQHPWIPQWHSHPFVSLPLRPANARHDIPAAHPNGPSTATAVNAHGAATMLHDAHEGGASRAGLVAAHDDADERDDTQDEDEDMKGGGAHL